MTGWSLEKALGKPIEEVMDLVEEGTFTPLPNPIRMALSERKTVGMSLNTQLRSRDGTVFTIEDSASPILDSDGQLLGAILVFHDVSEARAMAIRMSHLARHDSLTGLPNRVLMYDRVLQAILQSRRLGQPFALLFLDLDHFKEINDLLGHHIGDLLLKEVGNRLKSCLRASDTVSRQGGDEFIILLTNLTEAEHAEEVIHKLVEALSVPFVIDNHEITVTCSVGAALFPDDGDNPEDLLRHADAAMYLSKAEGRNCYHFYSLELHEHLQSRRRLQIDLRQALEELQFKLVYQPKVNIAQRKVVGAEALLRWQRPCGQIVPPLEFIPLAEETGLILPLGAWVLETACLQCEAWYQETGIRLPVAVNISAKQFADQHFVPMVQACLARTQLPPAYLELEVTESLLMSNAERTRQTVANLKQLGVRVAIDDFGTGYSSLSYLKNFEVHTLKIDRSFLQGVTQDKQASALVTAVVEMGKALGLEVIAEGIETPEEAEVLLRLGCDTMQGYLFSRPVPPEELVKWLDTWPESEFTAKKG